MKRTTKLLALFVCAVLLLVAADAKLARPERSTKAQNQFIGFHLVYERMPPSEEEYNADPELYQKDYSNWTEYGSDAVKLDGLGTVDFPRMILIGRYDEETNHYVFPGLEGKNCFLTTRPTEHGDSYSGYTDMAEGHLSIGNTENKLSGAVYFGPPLDDRNWNTEDFDYGWTAYRVYQMEDGTIYLDGSGNSYGGVGGFGFTEKVEQTSTVNGESTTTSLEISVDIKSIPRLDRVAVKQFDENDVLLRTDVLTAAQAEELKEGDGLLLSLEPGFAYAVSVETDVDGNIQRAFHQPDAYTSEPVQLYLDTWFLDEAGMGYCVPIRLEETP